MIITALCKQIIEAEQTYIRNAQDVAELRKELENLMNSNYRFRVELGYTLKLAKQYAETLEPKRKANVLKNLEKAEELL